MSTWKNSIKKYTYNHAAKTGKIYEGKNWYWIQQYVMWTSNNWAHGHLPAMVTCLYDPEVFLIDDEYKEKYNIEVNVQSEVEKAELYMLAQCQSNDNQLL